MIYHVLPGDSLVEEFDKCSFEGRVIVCREALISGPIGAPTRDQFWEDRARYVLAEYGEDQIIYHEKVADEMEQLAELGDGDEANLWFEYELLCSVNLWFTLSLLVETGVQIYRVEPVGVDEQDVWDGFAKFNADDLKTCFDRRIELNRADIEFGKSLWEAYRFNNHARLKELSMIDSTSFPHLREVVAAAIEQDVRPIEILREITVTGETDFDEIFAEFRKRAGIYGYGDSQVRRLLDTI